MIAFFKMNLFFSEGIYILALLTFLSCIGAFFARTIFYFSLFGIIFCFYFFRNPERICIPALYDSSVLICPADGKVIDIQRDAARSFDGFAQKLSIFLSPFDVHVTWMPIKGQVMGVRYRPGQFAFAFLPKSSDLNERNDVLVQHENGNMILVRQIAGIVARRICCWIQEGEAVTAGQKYGMIRFGSRVDLLLPPEVLIAVGVGQRVYGGQTVLGRWTC